MALIAACCAAVSSQKGAGTPAYMAPELLSGGSYGPKVDVYAFGVLLNEMLTRQQPWGAAGAGDIRTRVSGRAGGCLRVLSVAVCAAGHGFAAGNHEARDIVAQLR